MDLLEKICKELGIEIGEEWIGVGVHQHPPRYKIQDNTLWIYHKYNHEDDYNWKEASMADYVSLIKGEIKPMLSIKEITKKMKELTYSNDFEVAHSEADDLLIEAIKTLAIKHNDIENIAELINLYHSVGKYYA